VRESDSVCVCVLIVIYVNVYALLTPQNLVTEDDMGQNNPTNASRPHTVEGPRDATQAMAGLEATAQLAQEPTHAPPLSAVSAQ
jgi:hypothetical protein